MDRVAIASSAPDGSPHPPPTGARMGGGSLPSNGSFASSLVGKPAPTPIPTLDAFLDAFLTRLGDEGHATLRLGDRRTLAGLERLHQHFGRLHAETDARTAWGRRSFLHTVKSVFRPGPVGDFAGLRAVLSAAPHLVTGPEGVDGSYRLTDPRGATSRATRRSPEAVAEFVGAALDAFLGRGDDVRGRVSAPVPDGHAQGRLGASVARIGSAILSFGRRDKPG